MKFEKKILILICFQVEIIFDNWSCVWTWIQIVIFLEFLWVIYSKLYCKNNFLDFSNFGKVKFSKIITILCPNIFLKQGTLNTSFSGSSSSVGIHIELASNRK